MIGSLRRRVLLGYMVAAVVNYGQTAPLKARPRVLVAAAAVCAVALVSSVLAERSEAVFGKYKASLTLEIQQAPAVGTGIGEGYVDLNATGVIQSHQRLCRKNRELELWGRLPDGRADNIGTRANAPKGAFAFTAELLIASDDSRSYPPGTKVEFWVVAPKVKMIRFIGGHPLLCKRAVSPHVFVTVPVPPLPL